LSGIDHAARIAPAEDADAALASRVLEAVWVPVAYSIPHGFMR
jgi:hypothetical protein